MFGSVLAATFAITAAVFLGLRAQMLKPDLAAWPDAPRCVRWATFVLSAALGGYAVAVINGHPARLLETGLLGVIAAYAFLLWVNLYRQLAGR
ncbi:hypothetical protein [Brevundimonas sp.]|uniref:hypothetical protein n=1 Tax=Brevundimonas sp. TaxID=1871086 RepID=UPI0025BF0F82|nr:hypothetical protein [Brevundimonas sp.]